MYSIRFIWERATAAGRERTEREQAAREREQAAQQQAARERVELEGSGRRTPSPVPTFTRLSRPRESRSYAARRIVRIPSRCIALAR